MPKNWCFWSVVPEKTLESPLDCKETKPVNPEGNQSWIFIGRTDAKTPILWPPDVKYWLLKKDPDARKDWRQEEKRTTEDEMVGWHHWLNGHEFEQTPGVGDGQGSLVSCSPWGRKELDTTERLNWTVWGRCLTEGPNENEELSLPPRMDLLWKGLGQTAVLPGASWNSRKRGQKRHRSPCRERDPD